MLFPIRLVLIGVDVVYRCAPDSVKVLERVQLPSSTPISIDRVRIRGIQIAPDR